MKESQSHQAFAKWLDHETIPYVHSRTDRKHTNTAGDCDFYCFLAGRVLGVEFKTGRNKLSAAQEKRIAYLRQAGNAVRIVFSCEEAIQAVSEYFGVVNAAGEAPESAAVPSDPERPKSCEATGASSKKEMAWPLKRPNLFIGTIGGKDYVLEGCSEPGETAKIIRLATVADLTNLRRR